MTTKRPSFHITGSGWINDPCAPGYDPATKTYHLFYQCNPHSTEWGNMSWGHVVSKDMVTWTPISSAPALVSDQEYDCEGVFTGCWVPPLGRDDKPLRVIYSSIRKLPFHWSTPPYPHHAAGLALASSQDGGKSWNKSSNNPFLPGEPDGIAITGFRDPFLSEWPSMENLLLRHPGALYGLVSGGIQDHGPTTFLYEIEKTNPTQWNYIGPLVDIPLRYQPSEKWSGNYGINWECVNFLTLHSGSEARDFLIIGAEGDVEKKHVKPHKALNGTLARTVRQQVWMAGELVDNTGNPQFRYSYGGILDHGPYYAANSFQDCRSGRRIVYGWIPEEDVPQSYAARKGWNGCLAIPRELFLLRITNVSGCLSSDLSELSSFERKLELDGSSTMTTLGVKPLSELVSLREGCIQSHQIPDCIALPKADIQCFQVFETKTFTWELEATIKLQSGCKSVGFRVHENERLGLRTSITFWLGDETIIVDRSASTQNQDINVCTDAGPFTLFTVSNTSGTESLESKEAPSSTSLEHFRLRVFSDGDILEVFANDRFALSTMVYSQEYGSEAWAISAFAGGAVGSAIFEHVRIWDGIGCNQSKACQ